MTQAQFNHLSTALEKAKAAYVKKVMAIIGTEWPEIDFNDPSHCATVKVLADSAYELTMAMLQKKA